MYMYVYTYVQYVYIYVYIRVYTCIRSGGMYITTLLLGAVARMRPAAAWGDHPARSRASMPRRQRRPSVDPGLHVLEPASHMPAVNQHDRLREWEHK